MNTNVDNKKKAIKSEDFLQVHIVSQLQNIDYIDDVLDTESAAV
jgi:hypothetical protein